jgi:hypothetical protein
MAAAWERVENGAFMIIPFVEVGDVLRGGDGSHGRNLRARLEGCVA